MGVDELSFNGLRRHSKLMKGAEKGTEGRRWITYAEKAFNVICLIFVVCWVVSMM